MKKLLSMITVSTLVGTSASSLEPVFINNFVNAGSKSNQLNKDLTMTNNPFISEFKDLKNKKIEKVMVARNGTIYAGSITNGLYKSKTDGTFEQVNGIPDNYAIQSIDISPLREIWVGTNQDLYFSNDDGISFNPVTNDKINNITSVTIAPNGTVYVAVYGNGLWKLTKGDTDFRKITSVISSTINSIYISTNGTIFFGASFINSGLYKSTDDGISFRNVYPKNNINTIAVAPNGTIYATVNTKLNKSTDGGINFSPVKGISDGYYITSVTIAPNGSVYVGTEQDGQHGGGLLYKSTDEVNFKSLSDISETIKCVYLSDDNIYFTTGDYYTDGGLFKGHLINDLLKINKPDYWGSLFDGFTYKNVQKIGIKNKYLKEAKLDGNSITIPTTDLDITIGEHTLILTLKDEYKKYLGLFSGDITTGQVTYKLWVKTSIDKNQIDYQTKIDDTQLYTGLVSNAGNTNNKAIIQTKIKDGTGTHDASLNIDFKDILIDFDVNKSFYEQGAVDETTNNFTATGSKQKITKNLSIKIDGTYHLHLVDTVGNTYDSYLELGESNWKLKGTFDDSELGKLKSKLNVTVNLTDPSQKSEAMGWLHQYENFVDKTFEETIKTNGKGFDSEIKNQITFYTAFLKPLTYDIANEPKFDDGLDKNALVKTINDKANEILSKGLDALPKNLNVNTSNVVNKSTLEHYANWINNYQNFINKNKDKWINDIEKIASRGFASHEQENQIKEQIIKFLNNDKIKNYLKNIVWEDNKLLKATSNDYQQFVELDKLQSDTITWVNKNIPEINQAYQQAIKDAEKGLNLHGYSIDELLNAKFKPQTKSEIDNFADGQSFHNWLQAKADNMYHIWQLKIGLPIGLILLGVTVFASLACYWKFSARHNPIKRAKKTFKPIPDKNIKKKSK